MRLTINKDICPPTFLADGTWSNYFGCHSKNAHKEDTWKAILVIAHAIVEQSIIG